VTTRDSPSRYSDAPNPDSPNVTIASARRDLGQRFRAAGLDSPELDARVLISHALGMDHAHLAAEAGRRLTREEAARIAGCAERRLAHEPVARIVGAKEFWGLELRIDGSVLVPRPDTETVVEAALAVVDARHSRTARLRFADIGVGSGALLLALLSELPNALGVGTDRDSRSIAVARANAVRLDLGDRASFVACDYGAALAGGLDLVVANPPYVPTHDIATLAPEVREFDPRLALDGGPDGLDAYRLLAADARRLLSPRGAIVVEIGIDQRDAVMALFDSESMSVAAVRPDMHGIPRAVTAFVNA
jgi:release factor glutamine methyltransferase